MLWLAGGSFLLGVACGAAIRLMLFVAVLLCAAVVALTVGWSGGIATAALNAVVALVALQVGYVAGLISRARLNAWRQRMPAEPAADRSMRAPLGGKRP